MMEGVTTGKFVRITIPNVHRQAEQARVLRQERAQGDLVGLGRRNQVAGQEQRIEKVTGLVIGSNEIKTGIGRVRGVV
jgi:hypothetical protein